MSKTFCPVHAESGAAEGIGENRGASSGMDGCTSAETAARENDHPITLRRDFDSTDIGNTCSGE